MNPSPSPQPPRLLDQVRDAIRLRHFSLRTEQAYVRWIKRFILFHGKRHPRDMGAAEVQQFLTWLAVEGQVAALPQGQALAALLFLYKQVLAQDLPWFDEEAYQPARSAKRESCAERGLALWWRLTRWYWPSASSTQAPVLSAR